MNGLLKNLVVGLFYPAVLGAISYKLLDIIIDSPKIPTIVFGFAIVFHYVMDYVCTATETKSNYNWRSLIFDFMIIMALFVASNSIWNPVAIEIHVLFSAMVATKIGTLFWDQFTVG